MEKLGSWLWELPAWFFLGDGEGRGGKINRFVASSHRRWSRFGEKDNGVRLSEEFCERLWRRQKVLTLLEDLAERLRVFSCVCSGELPQVVLGQEENSIYVSLHAERGEIRR